MLNELRKLSVTLASQNIEQKKWHDQYKILPGGDCYRVWLGSDGAVTDVEQMSKDLVNVCRKFGNNQQAFPAFNIAPLYRVVSDEDREYYDAFFKGKQDLDLSRLHSMCACDNWSGKLRKKIIGCLRKQIPHMPESSAMAALMRIAASLDVEVLRTTLEGKIWEKLPSDIKAFLPLLVHKGSEKKEPDDDIGSVSVLLDLADWAQYEYPVANEHTTMQVNDWLFEGEGDAHPEASDRLDAFGSPFAEVGEPMPSVRIAPGFDVVLRSMFTDNLRDQMCQVRYGKAEDESYPISKVNREAFKTSLDWVVRPDNENVTWRKIDQDAMLFVYPNKIPAIRPKFAALFGGSDYGNNNAGRFEDVARQFITTLNGIETDQKPENIQVFALQQIKPALSRRAKVIFTRNLTPGRLIEAANEWQHGCHNHPPIAQIETTTPFPLNVSKTANKVWKSDGARADGKSEVKLMRYYQGMELLLDKPMSSQILLHIAQGVTANAAGLVLCIGNDLAKGKNVKDALKAEIGSLIPLLGLLLYKAGITKEVYMQDTAYSIGQLLRISDELHALYCEIKREGEVPPQLAGNSVFVTASETPAQALALLCTRMNPYIAWADQYRRQGQEKSGLAAWYKRQYGALMPQLHEKLTENIRFGDLEKAQLFIGYLAELPKLASKQSTEEVSTNEE